MSLTQLSEEVGITIANLSNLKTGKAKAIRFSTLVVLYKKFFSLSTKTDGPAFWGSSVIIISPFLSFFLTVILCAEGGLRTWEHFQAKWN